MSNQDTVLAELSRLAKQNPALYTSLTLAFQDMYKMYEVLFPTTITRTKSISSTILAAVTNFALSVSQTNIRFTWDRVTDAFSYEIRMGETWETGFHILTTQANSGNIDPRIPNLVYGTYTFLIKALTSAGVEGI